MDIQTDIMKLVNDCVADIKRRHVAAGQRVTGRTMNALEARARREGTAYVFEILGAKYTGAWETGSRPARKRVSEEERREFIKNLAEWCRLRGFPAASLTAEQYERAARWLKWYIGKHGSALYRKGGRRDIITPAVQTLQAQVEQYLADYMDKYIATAVGGGGSVENKFFKGYGL